MDNIKIFYANIGIDKWVNDSRMDGESVSTIEGVLRGGYDDINKYRCSKKYQKYIKEMTDILLGYEEPDIIVLSEVCLFDYDYLRSKFKYSFMQLYNITVRTIENYVNEYLDKRIRDRDSIVKSIALKIFNKRYDDKYGLVINKVNEHLNNERKCYLILSNKYIIYPKDDEYDVRENGIYHYEGELIHDDVYTNAMYARIYSGGNYIDIVNIHRHNDVARFYELLYNKIRSFRDCIILGDFNIHNDLEKEEFNYFAHKIGYNDIDMDQIYDLMREKCGISKFNHIRMIIKDNSAYELKEVKSSCDIIFKTSSHVPMLFSFRDYELRRCLDIINDKLRDENMTKGKCRDVVKRILDYKITDMIKYINFYEREDQGYHREMVAKQESLLLEFNKLRKEMK